MKKMLSSAKEKGKYFKQLFLIGMLLFLVPLAIFCGFYCYNEYTSNVNQILDKQQVQAENAVKRLDEMLFSVTQINGLIAANPTISSAFRSGESFQYQPYVLFDLLSSYCNSTNLIHDIYMHYQGDRWVYGRSAVTILRFYTEAREDEYVTLNGNGFLDTVTAPENFGQFMIFDKAIANNQPTKCILYSMPVYKRDSEVKLLCTVELKLASIMEGFLSAVYNPEFSNVLLISRDGTLINDSVGIAWQKSPMESIDQGEYITLEGTQYKMQTVKSNAAGWTVVLLTDMQLLAQSFSARIPFYIGILCIVLFIGVGSMAVFLNASYTPVYNIYKIAQEYVSALEVEDHRGLSNIQAMDGGNNEIRTIHNAIDNMLSRVLHLSSSVRSHENLLELELWMDVVNRKLTDKDEFEKRAKALRIPTDVTGYCIMMTEYEGSFAQAAQAYDALRSYCPQGIELRILGATPLRRTPWLMTFGENTPLDLEVFAHIGERMAAEYEVSVLIGLGQSRESFDQIPYSYFEAFSSLEFCRITGKRQILYDEIDHLFLQPQHKPVIDLSSAFCDAILKDDGLGVHESLNRIISFLTQYNCPIYNVRRICFDLYNKAMDTLAQGDKQKKLLLSTKLVMEHIHIKLVDDAVQFIENLDQLTQQCMGMKQQFDMKTIIEMVQAQYANPDFSFSTLAMDVNMSNSTFTRAFRGYTGMLPIDYLTNMRIEKAKQLLSDTNLPVLTVLESVGYFSASSFNKRFKALTKVTPREYRQQHQTQSNNG